MCDLTYAITFHFAHGVKPIRIPQSIASGLLGMTSYENGWLSASLGSSAPLFHRLLRRRHLLPCQSEVKIPSARGAGLRDALWSSNLPFSCAGVVLPLSAAPHFKSNPLANWTDFAVHVFLIGLPIALMARRYGSRDFGPEVGVWPQLTTCESQSDWDHRFQRGHGVTSHRSRRWRL